MNHIFRYRIYSKLTSLSITIERLAIDDRAMRIVYYGYYKPLPLSTITITTKLNIKILLILYILYYYIMNITFKIKINLT